MANGQLLRGIKTAGTFDKQADGSWKASAGFSDLVAPGDKEGADKLASISLEAAFNVSTCDAVVKPQWLRSLSCCCEF